jgi:hypothetical protein
MLGQLDGKSAYAAGASLNEDLLSLLQLAFSTVPAKPSSPPEEWKRASSIVSPWLERERSFLDADELSERTDPKVIRPRIDLIARA